MITKIKQLINQNRVCIFFNTATFVSFVMCCLLAFLNVYWPEIWYEPVRTSINIYGAFFFLTVFSIFTEANHKCICTQED